MGEVFAGRFELLEPIAEGGMGSVWLVRDRRDRQVYAGKFLRQSDAGLLMRFIREQSTRIEHTHVVRPLSWAGEDDRVVFTMPLMRGGSVATLVGDYGALPTPWVATLIDQTLQGLLAVHAAGVVHRDIKPANLLLEPTGHAKPWLRITDFGASAPINEPRITRASQVFSTPGYTAPEQLQGQDLSPAHDLYSVGQVGLELLTGLRPPASRTAAAEQCRDPLRARLVGLMLRAIDQNPAARPGSVGEFRAMLGAVCDPGDPWIEDLDGPYVFDHHRGESESAPRAPATLRASPKQPVRVSRSANWPAISLLAVGLISLIAAVLLMLP